MTSIGDLSMESPSNVIRTPPPPALPYTPTPSVFPKQHQTDLSMNKPPSSTLVNLLKQRRSPPPQPTTVQMMNNAPSSMGNSQTMNNAIVKQTRKPTKKSQSTIKRLSVNQVRKSDRVKSD